MNNTDIIDNRVLINSRIYFLHALFLLGCMCVCGLLSVSFGKELTWDLANYHYYQPYAYLHNRMFIDYWPSSFIHQYINPAIDFLPYFFINNLSPRMTEFILGAIHGINIWLLFIIANQFIANRFLCIIIALLGMYAPTALFELGSFQNDDLVSLFVLGFMVCLIRGLQQQKAPRNCFVLAGLLLGISVGLKLPMAVFAIGALAAIMFLPNLPVKERLQLACLITFYVAIGVFISSGYWMLLMWKLHHNPLFPFYFNNLFHADYPVGNWRDYRFLPHGILETLFFPFYFSWDGRTADGSFRDFRFAIVYVLFIFMAGLIFFRKKRIYDPTTIWLFAFFIFSYIVWQYYFSIARYLVPLEMLCPLIIYLLLRYISPNRYIHAFAVLFIFCTLCIYMEPLRTLRVKWYDSTFFNVQLPPIVKENKDAIVLIGYSVYNMQSAPKLDADPRPEAYLIPFFPQKWRFIGVPFMHQKYIENAQLKQKIHGLMQSNSYPVFLLTSNTDVVEFYRAALLLDLVPVGKCENIYSDRQKAIHHKVFLCQVMSLS